ncbi:hypothetical protein CIW83_12720 [Tissierella sp. P1]|jgi:DNA-binding PadR family transcriptional regulator|uniref:PadR family transcriptional regulator n=1 Tax=Tissierella TaxID=41273 RepID=UPI000B9FF1DD|nr:PadR family transcriptional regulator [Tissierella sp. P1]OZV11727.1 hypothetical protein CIW83_12720 [Tissierella sp. P1]
MARTQLQNLTEPMYYILLTLTKERHGYEIMQTIEKLTEGRVVVGPGTLYSLLSRFQEEEIIRRVSDEGRRKTYIITKLGTEILEGEINRLRQLISDGEGILKYGSISKEDDTTEDKREIKDGYKTRKSIFKRPDDDILF